MRETVLLPDIHFLNGDNKRQQFLKNQNRKLLIFTYIYPTFKRMVGPYKISWAGAIKDTSLNFQRGHLSKRASLQASLKL